MLDSFFRAQAADVTDEELAVRKGCGDGEGVEIKELMVGNEDFVSVVFEMPFGTKSRRIKNDFIAEKISHLRKMLDEKMMPVLR